MENIESNGYTAGPEQWELDEIDVIDGISFISDVTDGFDDDGNPRLL